MNAAIHPGRTGMFRRFSACLAAAAAGLMLSACGTTYEKREADTEFTQLLQPQQQIADDELLGVRIATFDPGELPQEADKAKGVSGKIRNAEAYFIAVRLRDTMERSGHWGPVRVVPKDAAEGEVIVNGEILESDGEILRLQVEVSDASGASWFAREYKGVVNQNMYADAAKAGTDVFQFLYNRISNDIALHRKTLAKSRIARIRQIAELKFAGTFAPDMFGDFLKKKETENTANDLFRSLFVSSDGDADEAHGEYRVVRLPAEGDPSFQRVQRIRAREHLLVDTLDQQYEGLSRSIEKAYTQWRTARLTEMNAVRRVEQLESERAAKAALTGLVGAALIVAGARSNSCAGCGTVAVTAGTIVLMKAIQDGMQLAQSAGSERELHQIALEELGQSLASEVSPVVLEVEGEVIELKGSVDEKFAQWREIMKKLHEQEVGPIEKAPAQPLEDGRETG